jgi:hypothetical protein
LAETRMKGYGIRDQSFVGGAYGRHSPDGLAGIAVPLLDARRECRRTDAKVRGIALHVPTISGWV